MRCNFFFFGHGKRKWRGKKREMGGVFENLNFLEGSLNLLEKFSFHKKNFFDWFLSKFMFRNFLKAPIKPI